MVRQFSMWIQNQKTSEVRPKAQITMVVLLDSPWERKLKRKSTGLALGAEGTQHPLGSFLPIPSHLHSQETPSALLLTSPLYLST